MVVEEDRVRLLQLAREALTAKVAGLAMVVPGAPDIMARLAGAFVTLHRHGDLRGCIGHVEADEPLGSVIARCAVAAGTSDPRFSPVAADELSDIHIEISILSPLAPVTRLDEIEIGKHGLVVEMGWHRGLLLPQVATEWKWNRESFAAETCRKAGLPVNAWEKGAAMWRFEAEVFGEK